jgi:hypothetical protein
MDSTSVRRQVRALVFICLSFVAGQVAVGVVEWLFIPTTQAEVIDQLPTDLSGRAGDAAE